MDLKSFEPIDWAAIFGKSPVNGKPFVINCPACLGSGWHSERVACFACEGHGHNGPRAYFDGTHPDGFKVFDSLSAHPEKARALVRDRLKKDGIDMADNAIDACICEFLIGMKDLGYRSIELNSVAAVYD